MNPCKEGYAPIAGTFWLKPRPYESIRGGCLQSHFARGCVAEATESLVPAATVMLLRSACEPPKTLAECYGSDLTDSENQLEIKLSEMLDLYRCQQGAAASPNCERLQGTYAAKAAAIEKRYAEQRAEAEEHAEAAAQAAEERAEKKRELHEAYEARRAAQREVDRKNMEAWDRRSREVKANAQAEWQSIQQAQRPTPAPVPATAGQSTTPTAPGRYANEQLKAIDLREGICRGGRSAEAEACHARKLATPPKGPPSKGTQQ